MSYYTTYLIELNPCGWERYHRAMCTPDPPLPYPDTVRLNGRLGGFVLLTMVLGRSSTPDDLEETLRRMGVERCDYFAEYRGEDQTDWKTSGTMEPHFFVPGVLQEEADAMTSDEWEATFRPNLHDPDGWTTVDPSFPVRGKADDIVFELDMISRQISALTRTMDEILGVMKDMMDKDVKE